MNPLEDKKTFFELGIAFARFSAKPDEDEHEIICKVASRPELEIPDYSELLTERVSRGIVTPPSEWFEGSNGASRRNYYRIGTISFAMALYPQGNEDNDDGALTELIALFRVEAISEQILNDYVMDLKVGNAVGALKGFVAAFSKALSNEEYDNDPIQQVQGDIIAMNPKERVKSFKFGVAFGLILWTSDFESLSSCQKYPVMGNAEGIADLRRTDKDNMVGIRSGSALP